MKLILLLFIFFLSFNSSATGFVSSEENQTVIIEYSISDDRGKKARRAKRKNKKRRRRCKRFGRKIYTG